MNWWEAMTADCQELDRQCRLLWNYDPAIFDASCAGHMSDHGCQGAALYYWHEAEEARRAAAARGCRWAQRR